MANTWLPTLKNPDLQSGYDRAIMFSRMEVKLTRPDAEIRRKLRSDYEKDASVLIDVSAVVAANFHTVVAANKYWSNT